MDGIFKTVPKFFQQIYVIRDIFVETYITVAYILMQHRRQQDHEIAFTAIRDKAEELEYNVNVTNVMADFENAPRRAIQDIFGDHIYLQGCFFHLTQCTWRKVKIFYKKCLI